MSLKIKGWRKIVKWSVWALLAILLIVFLVRVLVFENNYYGEKEGSERSAAIVNEGTDLDETEPTDDEVKEYTVAPDRPRYLTVEKLGVKNARVLPMRVNTSGELDTPRNIFDVGWYEASGKPGQGGTLMIDGHNGGPHVHGVFKNLPDLATGDIIKIERGDGAIFNYKVVENKTVTLEDSDAYMSAAARSPEPGTESVTLITCTGEWSSKQQTYLSRQFTRAILVDE
ncbi:class F sortase [Candidatus Saccharibacteria bacterium]|nr:class F sortase [Candidatus Saccharibacteria bacterium]